MKYEAPSLDFIKLDVIDVILTSGSTAGSGTGNEDETPFDPAYSKLDLNY